MNTRFASVLISNPISDEEWSSMSSSRVTKSTLKRSIAPCIVIDTTINYRTLSIVYIMQTKTREWFSALFHVLAHQYVYMFIALPITSTLESFSIFQSRLHPPLWGIVAIYADTQLRWFLNDKLVWTPPCIGRGVTLSTWIIIVAFEVSNRDRDRRLCLILKCCSPSILLIFTYFEKRTQPPVPGFYRFSVQ